MRAAPEAGAFGVAAVVRPPYWNCAKPEAEVELDELSLEPKASTRPSPKVAPTPELARPEGSPTMSIAQPTRAWQSLDARPARAVQRKADAKGDGQGPGQSWHALDRRPLQRRADPVQQKGEGADVDVHAEAARGLSGSSHALPHLDTIQQSFGHHDVTGIQAHSDDAASSASAAMGARAYATGNSVAFGGAPDLHTAAHEAAHVVQQRAGVSLSGGVGQVGDAYEQHADRVADAVVAGKSASTLLDSMAGGGASEGVQRSAAKKKAPAEAKSNVPKLAHEKDADGKELDLGKKAVFADKENKTDDKAPNKNLLGLADPTGSAQFQLFVKRMEEMINKLEIKDSKGVLENPETLAKEIWFSTVAGLSETEAAIQAVDNVKVATGRTDEGQVKKSMRQDLHAKAYQDLVPKFDALVTKLKGYAKLQGKDAKTWAFWSTGAGKQLAKNCEMSLEGGAIGYLFDGLNISGGSEMHLWGALSRAYAEAAVETLEKRNIEIFIGPYVADITVYDAIEAKILFPEGEKNKKLNIDFHAVATTTFDAKEADLSVAGGKFPGTVSTHKDKDSAVAAANAWADAKFKDTYAANKVTNAEKAKAEAEKAKAEAAAKGSKT